MRKEDFHSDSDVQVLHSMTHFFVPLIRTVNYSDGRVSDSACLGGREEQSLESHNCLQLNVPSDLMSSQYASPPKSSTAHSITQIGGQSLTYEYFGSIHPNHS